jgi:hypothetical protein
MLVEDASGLYKPIHKREFSNDGSQPPQLYLDLNPGCPFVAPTTEATPSLSSLPEDGDNEHLVEDKEAEQQDEPQQNELNNIEITASGINNTTSIVPKDADRKRDHLNPLYKRLLAPKEKNSHEEVSKAKVHKSNRQKANSKDFYVKKGFCYNCYVHYDHYINVCGIVLNSVGFMCLLTNFHLYNIYI